jgi:pyrimidine deaminase RibD-like protein
MDRALLLAARGSRTHEPQPLVGAVVVSPDGELSSGRVSIGRAGEAHAEESAR